MGPATRLPTGEFRPRHDGAMMRVLTDLSSLLHYDEFPSVKFTELQSGSVEIYHLLKVIEHMYYRQLRLERELKEDYSNALQTLQETHYENPVLSAPPNPDAVTIRTHHRYLALVRTHLSKILYPADVPRENQNFALDMNEVMRLLSIDSTAMPDYHGQIYQALQQAQRSTNASTLVDHDNLSEFELFQSHNCYR